MKVLLKLCEKICKEICMKRYEEDDNMTCYFIIDERNNIIRGWTDNKEYAKLYLDFHKCKYYKIKKITNTFREVLKIIEENSNDEISIYNINTRSNKKHESSKDIAVILPLLPSLRF